VTTHSRARLAAWGSLVFVLLLPLAAAAGLLLANLRAEQAPGRRVESAMAADARGRTPDQIDPSEFRPGQLPRGGCCRSGSVVYRIPAGPELAGLPDPAILVPSTFDNFEVYIDGQLAGGEGRAGPKGSQFGGIPILLRLPPGRLQASSVIDLKVERALGVVHLSPVYLGSYEQLYGSFRALRLLRVDLQAANAFIAAFVAAFCFCAAPLFPARGLLFSLAGLAAAWAGQGVAMLVTDPPWGPVADGWLYDTAFAATLGFTVWFFVEWTSEFAAPRRLASPLVRFLFGAWSRADRRRLGLVVVALLALFALAAALTGSAPPTAIGRLVSRSVTWFGIFAAMPFCLARLVGYYALGGERRALEIAAFAVVIVAAIADMVAVRFASGSGVFLQAAISFFPLALTLSLATRAQGVFEAATATTEKLNAIVAERERQIRESAAELEKREREGLLLEERARIMRDMHDGIGGQLFGLIVQARRKPLSQEALVAGLEDSLDDLRLVVDSLDGAEGSLALVLAAFRGRLAAKCEAAEVALDWRVEDLGALELAPSATLHLLRIVQEACTNALRHGRPTTLAVSVAASQIVIADDGAGFDVETDRVGKGLSNMRQRASRIGADLSIESRPGSTRITVELPR
jgi:two-component system, NarL family, sensor histidine kinase UhpB